MKSIFNLAMILPLAVFSVGLVGCSEPATPAADPAAVEAGSDTAEEPAASGDKEEEAASDKKEEGSGTH